MATTPVYVVSNQDANGVGAPGGVTGLGYATGVGGAVTQLTSRTTGVTLSTLCGAITLVAATDCILVTVKSSTTNLYQVFVTAVAAGSFQITFFTTGGTTSDSPVFSFAVIKSVAA